MIRPTARKLTAALLAAALLVLCCGGPSGEAALTVTVPGADKDPHKMEVQELLQTIADGIQTVVTWEDGQEVHEAEEESYNRWHDARKKLPEILQPSDVPAIEELMLKHTYEGMGKPALPMDDEQHERLLFASMCMRILRDYYIRTNDPQVTAFYLELLKSMNLNRGYLIDALLASVEVGDEHKTGKLAFLPGLEKTDWPEALHREYLKLETTEAQMTACDLLYAGEKYKDEATWLYCRILKESDRVYSAEKMKLVAEKRWEAHEPVATPREATVIDALGMMDVRALNAQDRELYAKYVIPWAKHFAAEGTPAVRRIARRLLDPRGMKNTVGWDIDLDQIPAGKPVPPKPDTVVEPEEKPSGKNGE